MGHKAMIKRLARRLRAVIRERVRIGRIVIVGYNNTRYLAIRLTRHKWIEFQCGTFPNNPPRVFRANFSRRLHDHRGFNLTIEVFGFLLILDFADDRHADERSDG